ncbi:hypothetical protein GCM10009797_03540 [Nocardioides hwasunensis]
MRLITARSPVASMTTSQLPHTDPPGPSGPKAGQVPAVRLEGVTKSFGSAPPARPRSHGTVVTTPA